MKKLLLILLVLCFVNVYSQERVNYYLPSSDGTDWVRISYDDGIYYDQEQEYDCFVDRIVYVLRTRRLFTQTGAYVGMQEYYAETIVRVYVPCEKETSERIIILHENVPAQPTYPIGNYCEGYENPYNANRATGFQFGGIFFPRNNIIGRILNLFR